MSRLVNVVLTLAVVSLLAVPAGATSFFDIFTDLPSVGPPYPSHDQGIGHMVGGAVMLDLVHHTMIHEISAGGPGGNPLPCQAVSLNGLPPGEPWGIDSFFEITYRIDLAGGAPWPVDSFFDIFCEVEIPGIGRAPLVPLHPALPPSDPAYFFDITYIDSFFDIYYRVSVGPGGGCHELHVHGEIQPGAHIRSLGVGHQPLADSFFDVFFEIEKNPGPIEIDPILPILKTTTEGQFLTGPLAAEPATWGKVKSLYAR